MLFQQEKFKIEKRASVELLHSKKQGKLLQNQDQFFLLIVKEKAELCLIHGKNLLNKQVPAKRSAVMSDSTQVEKATSIQQQSAAISICPAGNSYPLPKSDDYTNEFQRLKSIVKEQRLLGREIVVVMGLGFVGAVMAGVVADSTDPASGKPQKFVIGMQRPRRGHSGK